VSGIRGTIVLLDPDSRQYENYIRKLLGTLSLKVARNRGHTVS
jgi:hypothetical protein